MALDIIETSRPPESVRVDSIVSGGTGYVVSAVDELPIVGGTARVVATILVDAVDANGAITAVSMSNVGDYSVLPSNPVSVSNEDGSGATFDLTTNMYRYVVMPTKRGWVIMTQVDLDQKATDEQKHLDNTAPNLVKAAWTHCAGLIEEAKVTVTVSDGAHDFGLDRETRENIIGMNTAISRGITVPTTWTPKGELDNITITDDDMKLVGEALLNKKDQYIKVYLTHKKTLLTADPKTLAGYDVTTGYGAL